MAFQQRRVRAVEIGSSIRSSCRIPSLVIAFHGGTKSVGDAREALVKAGMIRKAKMQEPQMSVQGVSDLVDGIV